MQGLFKDASQLGAWEDQQIWAGALSLIVAISLFT